MPAAQPPLPPTLCGRPPALPPFKLDNFKEKGRKKTRGANVLDEEDSAPAVHSVGPPAGQVQPVDLLGHLGVPSPSRWPAPGAARAAASCGPAAPGGSAGGGWGGRGRPSWVPGGGSGLPLEAAGRPPGSRERRDLTLAGPGRAPDRSRLLPGSALPPDGARTSGPAAGAARTPAAGLRPAAPRSLPERAGGRGRARGGGAPLAAPRPHLNHRRAREAGPSRRLGR